MRGFYRGPLLRELSCGTSRTCTRVAGGRIIPLMEVFHVNSGIIQIIFPRCYSDLMVIMQSLTAGRRCRRHLMGARKCSRGGRDGSPAHVRKGETLISPPPPKIEPPPSPRCVYFCCGWTERQRSVPHAIKEPFYYTRFLQGRRKRRHRSGTGSDEGMRLDFSFILWGEC